MTTSTITNGEVLEGLHRLVDTLNAIPPAKSFAGEGSPLNRRSRAVLALASITAFIEEYLGQKTDAHLILAELGHALEGINEGFVDPIFKPRSGVKRSECIARWMVRALVVRILECERTVKRSSYLDAADSVCGRLKDLKFVTSSKVHPNRSQKENDIDNCLSWKKRLQKPGFPIRSVKRWLNDGEAFDRNILSQGDPIASDALLKRLNAFAEAEIDKWHPGTPPK